MLQSSKACLFKETSMTEPGFKHLGESAEEKVLIDDEKSGDK